MLLWLFPDLLRRRKLVSESANKVDRISMYCTSGYIPALTNIRITSTISNVTQIIDWETIDIIQCNHYYPILNIIIRLNCFYYYLKLVIPIFSRSLLIKLVFLKEMTSLTSYRQSEQVDFQRSFKKKPLTLFRIGFCWYADRYLNCRKKKS